MPTIEEQSQESSESLRFDEPAELAAAQVVQFLEQTTRKRMFVSSTDIAWKHDGAVESDIKLLVFAEKRSLSNKILDRHSTAGGLHPNYGDNCP